MNKDNWKNLSERTNYRYSKELDETIMYFYGDDVKEFIRRLKEETPRNTTDEEMFKIIDKLAGEKLK